MIIFICSFYRQRFWNRQSFIKRRRKGIFGRSAIAWSVSTLFISNWWNLKYFCIAKSNGWNLNNNVQHEKERYFDIFTLYFTFDKWNIFRSRRVPVVRIAIGNCCLSRPGNFVTCNRSHFTHSAWCDTLMMNLRFRVRRETSRVYVEFFIENLMKLCMGNLLEFFSFYR